MTREEYTNIPSTKVVNLKGVTNELIVNEFTDVTIESGTEVTIIRKWGPAGSTMEGLSVKDSEGNRFGCFMRSVDLIKE